MRSRVFRLSLSVVLTTVASGPIFAQQPASPSVSPGMAAVHTANYELAAKWTSQKVARLVFDTSVNPHWLESGDRFWYSYETRDGRKYWLVDGKARTKKPLFDSAAVAAAMTRITLVPYDAAHLPLRNLKFVKKDTVLQFEVELRRDALVRVGDQVTTVGLVGGGDEDTTGGGNATKSDDMKDKSKEKQTDKQLDKKLQEQTDDKTKTDSKTVVGTKTEETKTNGTQQVTQVTQGTQVTQSTGQGRRRTQTGTGGVVTGAPGTPPPSTTRTLTFEYDLKTGQTTLLPEFKAPPKKMLWASVSPDEKTIVFARGENLFMMDAANYARAQKKADDKTIQEVQLTTDGEEHYSFARTVRDENKRMFQRQERDRKDFRVPASSIAWSKDSTKFSVEREDQRKVADLWVINSLAQPRPTLETYRYDMPGEENVTQSEIWIFDVAAKSRLKVKADRFKDQSLNVETDRVLSQEREQDKVINKWLSDTADKLYITRSSRDRHKVDVCVVDTATGEVKTLIEERLNTYIDSKSLRLVNGGKEMLFWSERDGWGHYYLYTTGGKLESQVTSGEYNCQGIAGVDEKNRLLYVTVSGHEASEDPYYNHLYRVRLDGKEMRLMDAGDANHAVTMDDDARYFIDTDSRIDRAPHSDLCAANGDLLVDLEKADVRALMEDGFKFPEPFKIKADDGVTDLYGVIYKPFDFDPSKRYPVIEYVYPGPQTEAVSKTFSPRSSNVALAQLGFIVVEVGNRGGSPQRSKWYHNFGYGNLRDYGLADKKRAVEELALKYPWIDTDRVGIWGHSGGGFMSAAAMLVYPDFFKVAFSESGNHENNIYNRWWSESHHGVKENTDKDGKVTFSYDIDKNSELARNLKGHLMLVTGDIDNNVHPANTIRLANALIRANKRFDLFIFPGQRHGYSDMSEYCFWLRADYFTRNLLGDTSGAQAGADMVQLSREQAQTSSGSRGGGVGRAGGGGGDNGDPPTGDEWPDDGDSGDD